MRSGAGHGLEFRLVATDGTDLAALVRQGRYRGDLYMRLAVTELNLAEGAAGGPAEDSLRLFDQERRAILDALERTKGNRAAASRALGISRATLYRKLHEHGFE